MMEIRQLIIVLLFFSVCVGVSIKSFLTERVSTAQQIAGMEKGEGSAREESYFKDIDLHVYRKEAPALKLHASDLTINHTNNKTMFFNPMGITYLSDQTPVHYGAFRGYFDQKKEELFLYENVSIHSMDSDLYSNEFIYEMSKDRFTAIGNVKSKSFYAKTGDQIYVDADKSISLPKQNKSEYSGNVKGKLIRKRVYEENVLFDSDDMYIDFLLSKIDMIGNVFLKKEAVEATSRRGEIFLDNYNKKLKYFVLYDDVKVNEKLKMEDGSVLKRRAFAEKLEGIASEDRLILTGYPKVLQQDNVIKGNKIVLRGDNEVVEVEDASTNFILD